MSTSFSFVVPACNVEGLVGKTIDSIRRQSIPDFEALIVHEKSKDGTLGEIRKAVGNDPRFRIVELPCSGSASVSRNYGMENAKNEYLVFVDGDDWIEPDTLEKFTEAIEKTGHPDLLLANWFIHERRADGTEKIRPYSCHRLEPGRVYDGQDSLAIRFETIFQPGSPANICRREFLKKNRLFQFPGRRHQDTEWMPRVNFKAKTVAGTDFHYYHYIKHPGSVTTKPDPKSMVDFTDNMFSYLELREANEFRETLKKPFADWFGENFNCYFGSGYGKPYSRELREKEFRRLTAGDGLGRCMRILQEGGRSKRMLIRILKLAAGKRGFGAAEFFFRVFYKGIYLPLLSKVKRR